MRLIDLGTKVFQPVHFMAVLGQGSTLASAASYLTQRDLLKRKDAPDKAAPAGFTRYSGPMHMLFRKASERFGAAMDTRQLPAQTQEMISCWSDNPEKFRSADKPANYVQLLANMLEPESQKEVPLRLKMDGPDKPARLVSVKNAEIGEQKMPLARILFCLGKAGAQYSDRPATEENMIERTIDRAASIVENMQNVQDNLCGQLRERYHVQNPLQVLRDSGLDVDRKQLKAALKAMANLAAIYDAAENLHSMGGMVQQYAQSIRAYASMLSESTTPICQDATQARRLIESLHEYMLHKPSPNGAISDAAVSANRSALRAQRVDSDALIHALRDTAKQYPGDAHKVFALPQVKALVAAATKELVEGAAPSPLKQVLAIISTTQSQRR
ncbi:MAG: hypothetical protein EBV03_01280 [Proteobacteria bacterium]|nr:hypothetical protein [Pseudomonadota bacterium]